MICEGGNINKGRSHTRCGVKGRITAVAADMAAVVVAAVAVVETAAAAAVAAASAVVEEAGELKPARTKEASALQQKD